MKAKKKILVLGNKERTSHIQQMQKTGEKQ